MSRPNRVFFISKEFNFIQYGNTYNEYVEIVVKALSSGFGPYPVTSLKVVNKIATVDIGEKVRLYPGVKINIEGTGVTDIDTWHEIDAIHDQSYSFIVDVPDGEYTVGVTMGYPSLGWTLMDRDNSGSDFSLGRRLLFKNGISGSTTRYTLLSFNPGRPNLVSETWRHCVKVENVESDGTLNSIRFKIPFKNDLGAMLAIEASTPLTVNNNWYFYGDDAFVIMGHRTYWYVGTIQQKTANFNQLLFGELTKSPSKNGAWFANGMVNPAHIFTSTYTVGGQEYRNSGFGGILGGKMNIIGATSLVASGSTNEKYNYSIDCRAISDFAALQDRSGYDYGISTNRYLTTNKYGGVLIFDNSNDVVGSIPGVYHLAQQPMMSPAWFTTFSNLTIESFLKSVECTGRLKNRKVYAFFSSGYTNSDLGYGDPYNIRSDYQSTAMFDLTGPIR